MNLWGCLTPNGINETIGSGNRVSHRGNKRNTNLKGDEPLNVRDGDGVKRHKSGGGDEASGSDSEKKTCEVAANDTADVKEGPFFLKETNTHFCVSA